MRIEEMRPARAYLRKAVSVRHPPVRPPADEKIDTHGTRSDLEKAQWSVISFDGVVAGALTYAQAERLIDALAENGVNGLCVITDVAALNID